MKTRATAEYSDEYIQRVIEAHEGISLAGFPSIDAFQYLLKPQLDKLKEPAFDLLNETFSDLEHLNLQLVDRFFKNVPRASHLVGDSVVQIVENERQKVESLLSQVIEYELEYLFTSKSLAEPPQQLFGPPPPIKDLPPGGLRAPTSSNSPNQGVSSSNSPSAARGGVPRAPGAPGAPAGPGPAPSSLSNRPGPPVRPRSMVDDIRHRVDRYFFLVMTSLKDAVPKAIGHFLVRKSEQVLRFELFNLLNKEKKFEDSLAEPEQLQAKRHELKTRVQVLKQSISVLKREASDLGISLVRPPPSQNTQDRQP
mmetsp:Transcript_8424/g.12832  ORF Transcript_8424/g.12832 Transcript_8424/m.12832 type:complete len:310 (-) Transcript_8424:504-1433(-)